MSYPPALLEGMSGCGFRTDLIDLESRLKAARFATIAQSGALREAWSWVDEAIAGDAAALAAVGNRGADYGWISHSSITTGLRRERRSCEELLRNSGGDGTQRTFLAAVRAPLATRQETAHRLLRKRALRWDAAAPEAVVGAYLAFARRASPPPQEVVASALRTLLYAWCTGRRFKSGSTQCRLGCGHAQGDDQTHYVVCPVFVGWLARALPRVQLPAEGTTSALIRAMGVQGPLGLEFALANAVLLAAVDALRHSPGIVPVSALTARFKEYVLRHAQCRAITRGAL